jgi:surfeit locus 1 family protein
MTPLPTGPSEQDVDSPTTRITAAARVSNGVRKIIVLIAALVAVAATARLGVWQLQRAAQKESLQRSLDVRSALPALAAAALADTAAAAADQYDRRVVLRGRWLPSATVFLDNRQMNARQGFFVVTPLQLAGSNTAVLVQRGWVVRDNNDRAKVPLLVDAPGEITISGHIAPPPGRVYAFAGPDVGVIRQNLELEAFAREFSLSLKPLSVVQETEALSYGSAINDGMQRQWARPDAGIQRHYGYAFQWFALCALMTGLYVWFQLIRPRLGAQRRH